MNSKAADFSSGAVRPTRHVPELSKDLFVYAALALLVWGARQISLLKLFKPRDDIGYWLGVAGAVMMLILFSYPLRKHFRFARNWGPVRMWLVLHMVLGDEMLLGAVPMEDMDLVLSLGWREVTVDPCSPNIPHARVK